MKRKLDILTFSSISFLFLISLSAYFFEPLYSIVYFSSVLIPILFFLCCKKNGYNYKTISLKIKKKSIFPFLLTVFPVILFVFLLSYAVSAALTFFGYSAASPDVSGNILLVLLKYALMPAVCEEAVFRFIPLILLAPLGNYRAALVSALFFALAHASFFSIPYAFLAGFIFFIIDAYFESLLPSLILHFFNNVASVLWMRYYNAENFRNVFLIVFVSLALISAVTLFLLRKRIFKKEQRSFEKERLEFGIIPSVYVIFTLGMAFINLFGG